MTLVKYALVLWYIVVGKVPLGTLLWFLKHPGALVEQHEITGKNGAAIQTKELSAIELARRIGFLLAEAGEKRKDVKSA